MARIYSPLARLADPTRFDMTVHSDEERWPAHAVGYCVGVWDDALARYRRGLKACGWSDELIEGKVPAGKPERYHADGHASRAEASACYERFNFDTRQGWFETPTQMEPCAVCGEFTKGLVSFRERWLELRACEACAADEEKLWAAYQAHH